MASVDKLNTAEHDAKGRCVRHPDIRLRKKKLLGGWKIIIGHCPECCLDEMRRVRDEIDGKDNKGKKHKDKKHKSKKKKKRHDVPDDASGVESEGYRGDVHDEGGRRRGDGESEATGSTTPMDQSCSASVVSEQYVPRYPNGYFPPPPPLPPQQQQPVERSMVLSMAFTDPQTGQPGTYTGQVNSMNNQPDGKGTVYFSNGSIAEGTWSNGRLASSESTRHARHGSMNIEGEDDGEYNSEYSGRNSRNRAAPTQQLRYHNPEDEYNQSRPRSRSNSREPEENRNRSTSRGRPKRGGHPPPPPPPPEPNSSGGFSGNLHRLEALGGNRRRPKGGSASVQSYNSRASHQNYSTPNSGSSVAYSGSASVVQYHSGGGGVYYGGNDHGRDPPRGHHEQRSNGHHHRGPPPPRRGHDAY